MFTGIIEHLGKIEKLARTDEGGRLKVRFAKNPPAEGDLRIGSSISVNGCCLTVVELDKASFSADLSAETLRRTAFSKFEAGHIVNLELPLRAGDRLGGHFVQGHVDGVGRVARMEPEGENWWLAVRVPEDLQKYIAEKGSLAVDGVSLTVARWRNGVADFAIIPHTRAHTNLIEISEGDPVNLECDILAKYVESLMNNRAEFAAERWTVEKLIDEGF
ncbi:MAG TPA: riboflavin synthase [Candidatus Acidoferrales bacterium]|nr:riboflavin synthase [Candidatus Acidoferrales bacterium]